MTHNGLRRWQNLIKRENFNYSQWIFQMNSSYICMKNKNVTTHRWIIVSKQMRGKVGEFSISQRRWTLWWHGVGLYWLLQNWTNETTLCVAKSHSPQYSDNWNHKVNCPKQGRGFDSLSFDWRVIALRCCISFCCTRESAICVRMSCPSWPSLPPLYVTTEHWAEVPMWCTCFTRDSVHTSIGNSQFVPPSPSPPPVHVFDLPNCISLPGGLALVGW